MSVYAGPFINDFSLLLSLDFANPKNYTSGTSAGSTVTPYTFTFKNGATYNSVTNGILTTTRAATVTTKANDGGGIYTTVGGALDVSTFLYNDHTWECWFKINDSSPSNYDATEGGSLLAAYAGYHAGFSFFNTSNLYYSIWSGVASGVTCATFTVGSTNQNIIVGNWQQVVVTRSGTTFTPYVNGVQAGTGSTNSPSATGIGTGNSLGIGSVNTPNYISYAKIDFSNMKMYNRALSATEVLQNFNALRGRFSL